MTKGGCIRSSLWKLALAFAVAAITWGRLAAQGSDVDEGVGPTFQYLGPLTFGPDATLFAADSQAVFIYALDLSGQVEDGTPGTQNISGLDTRVAAMLGTDASNLLITDLVGPSVRSSWGRDRRSDPLPGHDPGRIDSWGA